MRLRAYGYVLFLLTLNLSFADVSDCSQALSNPTPKVFLSPEQWHQHLGNIWFQILSAYRVPLNGIVIEVAPGSVEKVGLGFHRQGFKGIYYIVEPHEESLKMILEKYKRLMPHAQIIPIQKTLEEAIPFLPQQVDAIVANHPLDDMILGKSLSPDEFNELFSHVNENSDPQLSRNLLLAFLKDSKKINLNVQKVTQEWISLIEHTHTEFAALSQYSGMYLQQQGLNWIDSITLTALNNLKSHWPSTRSKDQDVLLQAGQDPNRWFLYKKPRFLKEELLKTPQALHYIGEKGFLPIQAHVLNSDELELCYFNEELFRGLGYQDFPRDPEKLYSMLAEHLGLDLEFKGETSENTQTMWADYQEDPLHIAMNGNKGSGRAAYFGSHWNLKGVGRTPLVAADPLGIHGNGRLASSSALWETLISNVTDEALQTHSSPVLAIFKYKHIRFPAPWNGKEQISASVIIRVDEETLHRPTHTFQNSEPMDLAVISSRFAEQDAEKFIERIIHGAWSSGNISLQGHLLDMDTVTSVVGRNPQYSFTGKFPTNLFGLEYLGQLKILKALSENAHINYKSISYEEIQKLFFEKREERLQLRFLDLLGISPVFKSKVKTALGDKLKNLVQQFEILSSKSYPQYGAFSTWTKNSISSHVFDFSNLFRHYPLIKKSYTDPVSRHQIAIKYLMKNPADFSETTNPWISPELVTLLKERYILPSHNALEPFLAQAESFINLYEEFLEDIKSLDLLGDEKEWLLRAYVVNEDRLYLSDSYGARWVYKLAEEHEAKNISAHEVDRFLKLLIQANRRKGAPSSDGFHRSDFRIFKEGYLYRELDSQLRQRIKVHIFKKNLRDSQIQTSEWSLLLNKNTKVPMDFKMEDSEYVLSSAYMELDLLLASQSSLEVRNNNTVFKFTDYSDSTPRSPFKWSLE